MADEIRVDYDQLQKVAAQFSKQASAINQMQQQVKRKMRQLETTWRGKGATEFFAEMNNKVLPATDRLHRALQDASITTKQIAELMERAELNAAAPFQGRLITISPGEDEGRTSRLMTPKPAAGASAGDDSFWSMLNLKPKGNIWEYDFNNRDQPSKFDPQVRLRYGVSGALVGRPDEEGLSVFGGGLGMEFGTGAKGFFAGPYLEGYVVRAKTEGVWGNEGLGLTGGVTGKVVDGGGFAGVRHNSVGASIGASFVSVEGDAGVNVAGFNVGVTGEVGLKMELGFLVGQETELKLPFVSIGFTFGKAKRPDAVGVLL